MLHLCEPVNRPGAISSRVTPLKDQGFGARQLAGTR